MLRDSVRVMIIACKAAIRNASATFAKHALIVVITATADVAPVSNKLEVPHARDASGFKEFLVV
ncbi:hypothetical protein [Methylobacterium sp. J-077]|uniref:hypothetical protein n=1 Tax=Methylobacterium sp. J-077 TaxID=2836656 RepID=UPI001FBBC24E|nr:hypothetical protein [Methylobacterium sp. J-077]MCJ2125588.1 hypothetical protein [Methylobacterium sp. J-077]